MNIITDQFNLIYYCDLNDSDHTFLKIIYMSKTGINHVVTVYMSLCITMYVYYVIMIINLT